jgi:hypothetical protein
MEESVSPGSPVIRSRSPTMPKTSPNFDFPKPVAYDGEAKRAFHKHARRRLKQLADALGLAPQNYDLRSNAGGIAVSGEVTIPGSCSGRAKVARTITAVPITSPPSPF